jgi:hypothetical protein
MIDFVTTCRRDADGEWVNEEKKIAELSDEELVEEYGAEEESSTRRISSDPPSPIEELKQEILRRMKIGASRNERLLDLVVAIQSVRTCEDCQLCAASSKMLHDLFLG